MCVALFSLSLSHTQLLRFTLLLARRPWHGWSAAAPSAEVYPLDSTSSSAVSSCGVMHAKRDIRGSQRESVELV